MRPYICIYKGKRIELEANSSYEAQTKAGDIFKVKPKKQYLIGIYLADTVHTGT